MVEAIVEFNYTAQEDDELTIAVGDIIRNIRKDEGGWWEGELDGRRGVFPDNFVREIKKEDSQVTQDKQPDELSSSSRPAEPESKLKADKKGDKKRRCKVTFSYAPQNGDELPLKIGDIVEILAEVEEGWWEGFLNGRTGVFPSNFTKELEEEAEDASSTPNAPNPLQDGNGTGPKASPVASLPQCEDAEPAGSKVNAGEIQPKKVRGLGFGDIFKDKPIMLRRQSMEVDGIMDKAVQKPPQSSVTVAVNKVKAGAFCKAVFPYEAQNEDELSIKEGDIVAVISKEGGDPGWWLGELDGRRGVFPDNFVRLVEVDGEKERPKKPPPPGTSATNPRAGRKRDGKRAAPERPDSLPQKVGSKGDEGKAGTDVPKPGPPVIPPKKPQPPKTVNSNSLPAALPTKPFHKPERPPVPNIPLEGGGPTPGHCSSDRFSDIEVEDFDSIVMCSEKLSHPTASRPRVTDRRPRSQAIASTVTLSSDPLDSLTAEGKRRDAEDRKEEQDSVSKNHDVGKKPGDSRLPLPPKPSASSGIRPSSPSAPGHGSDSRPKNELLSMEELRTQLREMRGALDVMRAQHKKEIKQLMNELDEEKKIRLSLQMEVEHIKKVLSK